MYTYIHTYKPVAKALWMDLECFMHVGPIWWCSIVICIQVRTYIFWMDLCNPFRCREPPKSCWFFCCLLTFTLVFLCVKGSVPLGSQNIIYFFLINIYFSGAQVLIVFRTGKYVWRRREGRGPFEYCPKITRLQENGNRKEMLLMMANKVINVETCFTYFAGHLSNVQVLRYYEWYF